VNCGTATGGGRTVWERYFDRLVRLARKQLAGRHGGVEDEEDAALSAFDSFLRGTGRGRFTELSDRDDLWKLLRRDHGPEGGRTGRSPAGQKRGGAWNRVARLAGDDLARKPPGPRLENLRPEPPCAESTRFQAPPRFLGPLGDRPVRPPSGRGSRTSSFQRSSRSESSVNRPRASPAQKAVKSGERASSSSSTPPWRPANCLRASRTRRSK